MPAYSCINIAKVAIIEILILYVRGKGAEDLGIAWTYDMIICSRM